MEHISSKNVLDGLDYTIVDKNSQFWGIQNLERIRKYLLVKRDEEYNHVDIFQLPYILEQNNYIIDKTSSLLKVKSKQSILK